MRPDSSSFHATFVESHRESTNPLKSAMLLAATALLVLPNGAVCPLRAQGPARMLHSRQGKNADELKLVVILSRHGVRSPTWTNARLDAYSALPWPVWSVQPGYLTSHGYELMKRFGNFDRASLAKAGLVSASGCADAALTYIWADTSQRTIESGRALSEGLFPDCPPPVHALAAGATDPLFHSIKSELKPPVTGVKEPTPQSDPQQSVLLKEMQQVLLGCDADAACKPAHVPEILLLDDPPTPTHHKGGHVGELSGPLATASSIAEDFLLEYAEGMPMDHVAWGKVDEAQLRRLLSLHTEYSDQTRRTPGMARLEASDMLYHIERTLEQRVEGRPLADAAGPADSKLVLLAGHDTNLAGVAALLGLHWTLDGRTDDTPPGAELAFELWQNGSGAWSVRITVAMQTLRQMREMQNLTPDAPPARQVLMLEGCGAQGFTCSWKDFQHIADAAIDLKAVPPEKSDQP